MDRQSKFSQTLMRKQSSRFPSQCSEKTGFGKAEEIKSTIAHFFKPVTTVTNTTTHMST